MSSLVDNNDQNDSPPATSSSSSPSPPEPSPPEPSPPEPPVSVEGEGSMGEESVDTKVMGAVDVFLSQFYLSKFSKQIALQYMKKIAGDETNDNDRVKKWLMRGVNKVRAPPENCSQWQRGCPEKIPLLTAREVWDTKEFDWVERIESNFDVVLEELQALEGLDRSGFQPYRAPAANDRIKNENDGVGVEATDAGSWNVFYLKLGSVVDFSENREKCPKTVELLESIPGIYGHSFFSCLSPKSHITKHNGPTNKKLRCFLPLTCGENARLRVGSIDRVPLQKGKVLIWDDSFEHESWNDDERSRITLIFDIWHPETTLKERKFISFLSNSQLRAQKKIVEKSGNKDNFFSIIDRAQYLDVAKEDLWT